MVSDVIRIRMYRVGFGDCFLVSIPVVKNGEKEQRHILVDCGAHSAGSLGNLPEVVDNVAGVTDRKLAVMVASHAHKDHISGFAECADRFSRFEMGEVWLPWTDNPEDPQAAQLQRKQVGLAEQIAAHLALVADANAEPRSRAAQAAMANLSGNQKALQQLRSAFGSDAKVRYLTAGERLSAPADIPGLAVQVLGPPRDEAFLARMNPPAGQRFLRAAAGGTGTEPVNPVTPFSVRWMYTVPEAEQAFEFGQVPLPPEERRTLQSELADPGLESLAFALDQIRNNTSLVLLLTFRGRFLLFPGDAQYGNWRWWLDNLDATEILPRIGFLKVAHHGSHNASPREAIEQLTGPFAAMVSTQNEPWVSIPRLPLMDRLAELTGGRVVRSDSISLAGNPNAPRGPALEHLPAGFSQGDFWFDLSIEL